MSIDAAIFLIVFGAIISLIACILIGVKTGGIQITEDGVISFPKYVIIPCILLTIMMIVGSVDTGMSHALRYDENGLNIISFPSKRSGS